MTFSFAGGIKDVKRRKQSGISIPVTDGLFAYFDANNPNSYPGAGNIWRDLTSRNHIANVTTSIVGYNNRYGGHLVMSSDGTNTPATATTNLSSTNTVTLMAWINPNAVQNAWAGIIMDRAGTFSGMQFDGNGGTKLAFMWNTLHYTFDTGITVPANKWSLVSIVVTPTTITPYLNGTAGNVLTSTLATQTFSQFRLGWDNGATRGFQGKYGAAMIYNRSLSAAEVSSMYNFFKTRYVVADSNLRLHIDAGDSASYSGSGTAVSDISGNSLNCTLTNGPTFSNNSFRLDGVDDVILTNSNVDLRSDFTLECWAMTERDQTATGASPQFALFGQGSATNNAGLHLMIVPNAARGQLFGLYYNDASKTTVGTIYQPNTWYHFAVTYSHSSPYPKKMYVNGVDIGIVAEQTQGAYAAAAGILRIGEIFTGSGVAPTKGRIAQARYYNKVLTASEVLQNYNATKGIFYPSEFPASISGLQLWLRGDSGVYDANGALITADNTAVAAWEDRSGSSNKIFAQTTATQRPVLRTGANGVNGLPVLSFDGVDDELFSATNPTPTSNFSYFAVVKPLVKTGAGHTSRFAGRISGATGWNWGCTTTNFYAVIRNNAGTGPDINWGTSQAFSSPILSSVIMDSTKTALRINKNQIGTSTRTSWETGGTTEYIGSDGLTTVSRFQGYICEILIFNRALTDKELNMVENYLASKWGITKAVEKQYEGLVASWDAADVNSYSGSGTTVNDLTGNANTGTLTNSPTYSASDGGKFTFTRASSQSIYVSTLTNIPTGNSSASIELWYKHAGLNQDCGLVGWGSYGANYSVHALRTINTNGLRFYGWGGDLDTQSNVLTVNTWHHIVAIYNSNTQTKQVYINGNLVQTLTGVAAHSVTANSFYIGKTYSSEYAQGDIATVKIYDRALSLDEIGIKYRETKSRFGL